jgi:hypothetical protein
MRIGSPVRDTAPGPGTRIKLVNISLDEVHLVYSFNVSCLQRCIERLSTRIHLTWEERIQDHLIKSLSAAET